MFPFQRNSKQADLSRSPQSHSRQARHPQRRVSLQLESLEDRVVPTGLITLVPGNAVIPFSTSSQIAPISVQVNTPLGGLNLGTIDVALMVNGQPVTLAAAT